MAKRKLVRRPLENGPTLFADAGRRQRRSLFFGKYLEQQADPIFLRGEERDGAHQEILRWVQLEKDGHLFRKETALDANFLLEVFGKALGYSIATQSPEDYHLERNYRIEDIQEKPREIALATWPSKT